MKISVNKCRCDLRILIASDNIQSISDNFFVIAKKVKTKSLAILFLLFHKCSTICMSQAYLYAGLLEFAKFYGIKELNMARNE